MTHRVGIDLGTTNSAVARIVGTDPVVFAADTGERTVPSAVGFDDESNAVRVGRSARNFEAKHPDRVVTSVKRRMGADEPVARVNGDAYRPEEISALILRKLTEIAESELGAAVTNAVITVPAYFDNHQREATERAGRIAGLTVDRIINEPTAAMLAHGTRSTEDTTALVYDLGGGTFDVSVVSAIDGVFEVRATDGLRHHGGDDWDAQLVEQITELAAEATGRSPSDPASTRRIWRAARTAKHDLSHRTETTIRVPFLVEDWSFEESITREAFERMTSHLLEATIETCHDVLAAAGMEPTEIDEVVLVGGSTRMPQVERRLREVFGDAVGRSESPDEVVAKGAAIQAGMLDRTLPVVAESGSETLRKRERDAIEAANDDRYAADDDRYAADDDRYALPDVYDEAVLVDVTSRSLGTKITGDNFVKLVRRNTAIPAERTERFVTTEDEQTNIRVGVYQGESMTASENRLLDDFVISGLPRLPAGEAKIDVTFRINADGILEVTAESVQRGHADGITIDDGVEFGEREIAAAAETLPAVK